MQLFSSSSESFRSVGSSLLLLFTMVRGSTNLRPGLPESSGLYYLFCTSYIILEVWIVLRLFTVVLVYSYREMHFELYRPAFEPQDYEMVELFVRRLKMWMGFSKAKEVSAAQESLCGRALAAGFKVQAIAEKQCPPSSALLCLQLLPTTAHSQVHPAPLVGRDGAGADPRGPRAGSVMGHCRGLGCQVSDPLFQVIFLWDPSPGRWGALYHSIPTCQLLN